MAELFLKVLNMSISASWMVLAVLIARLCLKKAPKWISVFLWALVGFRLLCPFSVESNFSLIPSGETVPAEIMMAPAPAVQTGVSALDSVVNPVISQSFSPNLGDSANPLQIWIPVSANLWLLGIAVMLVYAVVSYLRLKLRIREATLYTENVYFSEISSPFVLGIVKPMIFLPYHIGGEKIEYVVAHEKAHILRKDHWWKPTGFLVLSVHWFNPVVWLAYILFCRDIELACDEKVVKNLSSAQRADYSAALVSCSTVQRQFSPCPLAFGEGSLKARVKAVLYYKKPTLWVLILALVLCVVIAICCLTDPSEQSNTFDPYKIPVFSSDPEKLQKQAEEIANKLEVSGNYKVNINADGVVDYRLVDGDGNELMQITEDEAVAIVGGYLKEMGLLPQGDYRTRVHMIEKRSIDSSGESDSESLGVAWVMAYFYRVFQGADVVTDQNDGISISFDAQGIRSMTYLWRDMQEGTLPRTEKPITAEEARQIYIDYMSVEHDHWDTPKNLFIQQVYASFGGQMRPCWQVSQGEVYRSPVYIDMFTGEILYA